MGDEDCSKNEKDDEQGDNAGSSSAGQEGRTGLESWIQCSESILESWIQGSGTFLERVGIQV